MPQPGSRLSWIGYSAKVRLLLLLLMVLAGCAGRAHRHGPPVVGGPNTLHVEVYGGGDYDDALRAGGAEGLSRVRFAKKVDTGGEVELDLDLESLDVSGGQTVCKVKVLVMRLPRHSLIGIAEGSARARGTDGRAKGDCAAALAASLVRGKVRTLLRRELRLKR